MSPGRSQFRRTEVHRSLFLFFFPSSLLCFHFLELTLYLYFWIFARGVGLRSAVLRFLRRACSSIRLVFFSVNGLTFQTLNQTLPLKVTMKIKKTVIVLMILKPKVSGFSNLSLHNFLKSKENYIPISSFRNRRRSSWHWRYCALFQMSLNLYPCQESSAIFIYILDAQPELRRRNSETFRNQYMDTKSVRFFFFFSYVWDVSLLLSCVVS